MLRPHLQVCTLPFLLSFVVPHAYFLVIYPALERERPFKRQAVSAKGRKGPLFRGRDDGEKDKADASDGSDGKGDELHDDEDEGDGIM